MNTYIKVAVLGAAAAATLLTSFEFAAARDRYPYWRNGHHGHYNNGRWVAAGVLGAVAAGVIVGSALAEPEPDVVYEAPRRVVVDEGPYAEPEYGEPEAEYVGRVGDVDAQDRYAEPQDDGMRDQAQGDDYFPDKPQPRRTQRDQNYAARGTMEPWTAEWRAYCAERYQSFNSRTGTYTGYDGQSHFCTAG